MFAAFALGAALGPTDAVAVASLSKETSISSRSKSILEGESLINDASGIVAFQFAIAAAVTGTFSLVDATADFLFSFFGGILMGIALGYLGNFLVRKVRSWGLENTTFHVLFEVFTPFIVYLVANALHTSGILAVVAAGLVNVISPRIIGPSISRMNIVSTSVWRVLSFALNGVVFVLLGTQLPLAFQGTWESTAVSNDKLIAYVLGLAFIVIFARFVWVMAMEWVHSRAERADRPFGLENVRTAAVMTLGGPKGAITLAVAFTISYAVPQRDLMIFMACGVIVVTLLLATFVVPLLAPKKPPTDEDLRCDETEVSIEILRTVIEDIGGGCPNGKKFKAAQTGGPSGGCIPASLIDTPMDYDSLGAIGSMMGSGGLIVMDEDNCMVDIAKFFLEFIIDESCGKCSPCRIGTKRLYDLLTKITEGNGTLEDLTTIEELCEHIKQSALCGLGQTAPNPVLSTLHHFRDEYIAHVVEKRCPAGVCKNLLHFVIDPGKCKGCTLCAKNCPANAIMGAVKAPHVIDPNKCIKCGACMDNCRFGAISKH